MTPGLGARIVVFASRSGSAAPLDPRLADLVPAGVVVFHSWLEVEEIAALLDGRPFPGGPAAAFCGLGNPAPFFDTLKACGVRLIGRCPFADHHYFRRAEIDDLRRRFPETPLICAAKDAVKIDPAWAEGVYVLKVRCQVSDAERFINRIAELIAPARR